MLAPSNNLVNINSHGDLPPILDIEKTSKIQSNENLVKGVKNWLKIIENHYGIKPIVYTGAHFYNDHLNNNLNGYLVWVANYNRVKNPLSSVLWIMWQFSDNGTASGIKGPVDLDLFKGTLSELKKYALK